MTKSSHCFTGAVAVLNEEEGGEQGLCVLFVIGWQQQAKCGWAMREGAQTLLQLLPEKEGGRGQSAQAWTDAHSATPSGVHPLAWHR